MSMKFSTIGVIAAISIYSLCGGCVPYPTPYGVLPVPIPNLIHGAIEERENNEKLMKESELHGKRIDGNWNQICKSIKKRLMQEIRRVSLT
ncbi:hypothetical protein PXJ20_25110 [Paraburkholderia sp. A1RI_3L]|uniref:hypothetical protein n=1 Tax=Paraburkholderia TaxID=1822464 RepID=UPI003B7B517F